MIKNTVLNNELNKSVRQITGRVKLYLDDTLVNTFSHNTNLISFDIERIGDENKFFGYGVCQKVNVKVIDREHTINPTTAQHLRIYFNDVRTSPKFYITEVHRDEKTGEISITAYDKIYFLNNSTISQLALSTSYTIKEFAQAVGSHSGMKVVFPTGNAFNTSYPNGANFDGTETLRDALDDVAEATSTIYYINHEDKIVFKQLSSEPVLTIDKSKYFDLSSKTNRRLVKIVHVTELGDNVGASLSVTGSVQYIRNNAFWDLRDDIGTLVNQSLDRIGGFTINQFECEWRGNPLLEIGDSISIITKNNESVFSNVLNDTISYDGSLSEKTSFTYENEEETEEDNPSDLGEALSQTFARVDKVNKEITLLVKDVSDNKTEISEIKQDVDNLSLTVKSTVQEVVKEEIGNVSLNVYTIVLSNEAQTIAVNNDRFPLTNETFTTDVQVYEGANVRTDFTIGNIASANGITVGKTASRVSFTVSTTSALTANNGAFTIPITIDGKTFNKTFSWSCAKQGSKGQDGASAKSVTVTGEQVFKYSENFKGTPTPETIILKATVSNTTETGKWQYMETDGTWTDYTKGGTLVTSKIIDILHNSKIFGTSDAKSMRLRYFISDSLYDEITLVKVSDGAKGTDGKNGIDGINGKDGVSTYFYVRYSANANGSNMTSTPSSSSLYIGVCSTTSKTAPTDYKAYQWTLIKGSDGKDGIAGAKGDNGKTSYLHIKYSNDGKTFTNNNGEELGKWIGTYVDFNQADSTSFGSYTWRKYVGEDGQDGKDGTDGKDGYTIILTNEAQTIPTTSSRVPLSSKTYSTDIIVYEGAKKRTDFTVGTINSANGITVGKPSNSKINFTVSTGTAISVDNGTFTIPVTIDGKTFNKVFSWSCSKQGNKGDKGDKGDNGADAMAVYITGEQVFKYSNNFTGTPTPETIPLTVTRINTTASGKWQYMDENSAWQDFTQSGTLQTGNTLNVSHNSKIFGTTSAKSMRVRYYISNTVYDEMTLIKVSDGAKGSSGITVVLTNENHSFLAGNRGNISTKTSATTKVYAYQGTKSVAFTLGTITAPTGMTITDNLASGGRTITFTVATGTSLADSGTIDIPVIVDGTTYTKTFSWSKALKGAQGNKGADAMALNIHASSQIFKSVGDTYEPSIITLTPKCENVTFSKWQYSFDGTTWNDVVSGTHGLTLTDSDVVTTYGNIVVSKTSSSITKGSTDTFTVKLDKAPTNNQKVTLSTNNSNATINKTSLTFTSSNYSTAQSVTITGSTVGSTTITLSSPNVSNKTVSVTVTGGSSGGSTLTIETANKGFNTDGSLDGKTAFTHTETYIPFSGNTDKIIQFGVEGWTRAIFYDSSKTRIGYSDSTSAVTSLSMSELQSKSTKAVYVRVSINQTTTITLVATNAKSVSTLSLEDDSTPVDSSTTPKKLVISNSSDLFTSDISSVVFKALATDAIYYDTMTIAKVKDLSEDLKELEGQVIKNQDVIASLQLNTDSINASVQRVEETFISTVDGINTNINSLTEKVNATMTSEDVKIEIQKEMANGTNKVSTSTGFTFDDNGLKVSKSDSEMSTQITEDGMKIYKNDEVMLTANNQGVDAKNLHATTYLIIGENSRMEDFTCDGTKRTAVFWIGSDN